MQTGITVVMARPNEIFICLGHELGGRAPINHPPPPLYMQYPKRLYDLRKTIFERLRDIF